MYIYTKFIFLFTSNIKKIQLKDDDDNKTNTIRNDNPIN